MRLGRVTTLAAAALLAARAATAQTALSGDTIHITRATGPITVDGDLSDAAWRDATRIEKWYQTKPGDNLEPKVQERRVPDIRRQIPLRGIRVRRPESVHHRAPYADRDNINGNSNDYGGLLLDARNTGLEQRPVRRDAPEHAVRLDHRRLHERGFVAGLLLGLGDEITDAVGRSRSHSVLVDPVQERGIRRPGG